MNTIREIQKINQVELERGLAGTNGSWHTQYAQSAWVYVGNLHTDLTEGDVICVMSQYGEVEDIHLVRDHDTGKSKGFAFIKYEDARSCILAVDNFIGSKLCGRPIRIDHVEQYRLPKHVLEQHEQQQNGETSGHYGPEHVVKEQGLSSLLLQPGHAYLGKELVDDNSYSIHQGQDLFAKPQTSQPLLPRPNEPLGTTTTTKNHHDDDDDGPNNNPLDAEMSNDDDDNDGRRRHQHKRKRHSRRHEKMDSGNEDGNANDNSHDDYDDDDKRRRRRFRDSRNEREKKKKKSKSKHRTKEERRHDSYDDGR